MSKIDREIASGNVERVELFSFFAGERHLSRYLNKLAYSDIYTIGDLVKMDRKDLFEKFPTSERNKEMLVSDLRKIGVHIT